MAENDDASLKDALAAAAAGDENKVVEEKKADADPAAAAAAAADKLANDEALEIGRTLVASGVTREKVNELLQAPQALNSLRYMIQNNPAEFLNLIERTDPKAGENFLEKMASTYVDRYGVEDKGDKNKGKGGESPELMSEVKSLREQLKGIQTREQQREQAASMAAVQSRYTSRVDDLFGTIKDMGLTRAESKALRADLDKELANDPAVVQRVSSGNFVDVAPKFKSLVENWSSDRKAAAQADKDARERAEKGASFEALGGPQPFMLDVPKDAANSWDATEDAFAAALTKASGAR